MESEYISNFIRIINYNKRIASADEQKAQKALNGHFLVNLFLNYVANVTWVEIKIN